MTSDRPMRDIGRLSVALMGPVLAYYLNQGEPDEERTTGGELRAEARHRPTDKPEAVRANAIRCGAWIYLMFAALILCIASAIGSNYLRLLETPLVVLVALTGATWIFAGGAALASVTRWTFAQIAGRYGFTGDPEAPLRRVVRWLATPSNADVLPALVFLFAIGSTILNGAAGD